MAAAETVANDKASADEAAQLKAKADLEAQQAAEREAQVAAEEAARKKAEEEAQAKARREAEIVEETAKQIAANTVEVRRSCSGCKEKGAAAGSPPIRTKARPFFVCAG